jgi:cbb3-type cytochrome oxidase maturation protein
MIVIFLLIPLSIIIAICFLAAFIWAVRSGQYEDTCTPAMRLLLEEKSKSPAPSEHKAAAAQKKSASNSVEAKNE